MSEIIKIRDMPNNCLHGTKRSDQIADACIAWLATSCFVGTNSKMIVQFLRAVRNKNVLRMLKIRVKIGCNSALPDFYHCLIFYLQNFQTGNIRMKYDFPFINIR